MTGLSWPWACDLAAEVMLRLAGIDVGSIEVWETFGVLSISWGSAVKGEIGEWSNAFVELVCWARSAT